MMPPRETTSVIPGSVQGFHCLWGKSSLKECDRIQGVGSRKAMGGPKKVGNDNVTETLKPLTSTSGKGNLSTKGLEKK